MESNNLWLLADDPAEGITPMHHHSGDDTRDFLMDNSTGEEISVRAANEKAKAIVGRRAVVGGMFAGAAATLLAPSLSPRMAFAAEGSSDHTLVVVFLRGGMDGLNVLAPYQDATYLSKRKTTMVTPEAGGIVLNDTFALHPNMKPLMEAWEAGHLSFAHATGTKDMTRSHFDEQARLERAAPVSIRTGWLGRYLMATASAADHDLTGFGFSTLSSVNMLSKDSPALILADFSQFTVTGGASGALANSIATMGRLGGGTYGRACVATVSAMKSTTRFAQVDAAPFSKTPFGRGMSQIAAVINGGVATKVVAIDHDLSWDTHASQKVALEKNVGSLASDLAAFRARLGANMSKVTVLVVSEFGRTTHEQGSGGTDHGRGNLMMCMSGLAAPKRVAGPWVGLDASVTDAQGDLEVQTDYRDVVSEILGVAMKADSSTMANVLPGYTPRRAGVLR